MHFIPNELRKTVRLPIKIQEGRVVAAYDGPLPRLLENTTGDLIVPAHAVWEPGLVDHLHQEHELTMLEAGKIVRFDIRIKDVPSHLLSYVYPSDGFRSRGVIGLVEVVLEEPLKIRLRGTKRAELCFVKCMIPALGKRSAISLNQAFTFISEAFEPGRQSHTGNAFQGGWYNSATGWRKLDALRQEMEETDLKQRFAPMVTYVKDHPLQITGGSPDVSPLPLNTSPELTVDTDYDVSTDFLPRLRTLYPHWVRADLSEVRILRRHRTVWLEVARRDRSEQNEEVHRTNLNFIVDDDNEFFPSFRTAQENAERFLYKLDPIDIIQCTDVFTPEAAEQIRRYYDEREQLRLNI